MADHVIDYDQLVQDAMRGILRRLLMDVADKGLPGDHHFYIVFDTKAPGISMSKRLRAQHDEEMTIVLQHQFTDLIVEREKFEISLYFNNVAERLIIPFQAIKAFVDPSVPYGFQLAPDDTPAAPDQVGKLLPLMSGATEPGEKEQSDVATLPRAKQVKQGRISAGDSPSDTDGKDGQANDDDGATVVELDAFRKK